MNDPIFGVLLEKACQLPPVAGAEGVQHRQVVDYPAQLPDLRPIIPVVGAVGQKIKLDFVSVHMPVIVHQHGFQPAPVHMGHDLQYFDHKTIPYVRFRYSSSDMKL